VGDDGTPLAERRAGSDRGTASRILSGAVLRKSLHLLPLGSGRRNGIAIEYPAALLPGTNHWAASTKTGYLCSRSRLRTALPTAARKATFGLEAPPSSPAPDRTVPRNEPVMLLLGTLGRSQEPHPLNTSLTS